MFIYYECEQTVPRNTPLAADYTRRPFGMAVWEGSELDMWDTRHPPIDVDYISIPHFCEIQV